MTNREAINLLEEVRVLDDSIYAYNKAYSDALEMALTALEAEEAWYETHEYPHKERWIPVTEKLPAEDEWVIGVVDDIHSGSDAPNVAIVKLRKGISKAERDELRRQGSSRSLIFKECDE